MHAEAPSKSTLYILFILALLPLAGLFWASSTTLKAAAAAASSAVSEPFRFHLFVESHGLDPQQTTAPSGNYLLNILYKGLFQYSSRKGLLPAGARKCERINKLTLRCTLDGKYRWSNGDAIKAQDYVTSFQRLIDPRLASPQSGLILTLKNARAIWAGARPVGELGVSAPDGRTLQFDFDEEDPEFEYKTIHPALSPFPPGGYQERSSAQKQVVNGPYRIVQWKGGALIRFEPNPKYPSSVPATRRPAVEAWFVEDDATALRLYEAGKLSFLRRLAATDIPRYQNSPEFHQIPMARFDYVGFGPQLEGQKELRQALISGVDFSSFLHLFFTQSPAGCPSLPARYQDKVLCQEFAPKKAKSWIANSKKPGKLEFHFSRMGGNDIARAAEWFQGQWKKNLGLRIELCPREQSVYLKSLKVQPPAIFRKGVSLDRPTCLAALELFTDDSMENYIHFHDVRYEHLVRQLASAPTEEAKRRSCREAVQFLLGSGRLIPLGEMYFTILAKTSYAGWDVNELNQLDLGELEAL